MNEIEVSAERTYSVQFTDDWLATLQDSVKSRKIIAITPLPIADAVKAKLGGIPLISVADGEAQKSPQVYVEILEQLAKLGLDRSSLLVGIGGGATTDLVGFVAATYLRGISWIAIPTTIAGMVDAAIGGKTGLNLESGKNLVGAFYSPERVIIDFSWTNTLALRDKSAGLAEALKCGFIQDIELLNLFEASELAIDQIVARAVAVKAGVVSVDFREGFAREALNYGHTLGHAIERHSNYTLRHGEAVSIGMIFAAELSVAFSGLDQSVVELHRRLLGRLNLPSEYSASAWDELFELMLGDKKRRDGEIRFVTLPKLGATGRYASKDKAALGEIYRRSVGR